MDTGAPAFILPGGAATPNHSPSGEIALELYWAPLETNGTSCESIKSASLFKHALIRETPIDFPIATASGLGPL